MTANADQEAFWSQLAPTWIEIEDALDAIAGPPGRAAMDRLELVDGDGVADIGCGIGRTTVELAQRVAPTGRATGFDIAHDMITHAREQAEQEDTRNISFAVVDAQTGNLGHRVFDAAYSRFGVMFFSDPVAAFTNIHSALRPDGRLAFVCWQSLFENEWMLVPGAAAISAAKVAPDLPDADGPGPFSLANPDRIRAILRDAGYSAIDIEPLNDPVSIPEADIPRVATMSIRVGPVRDALDQADEGVRQRVRDAVEDALRARVAHSTVELSRGTLIASARA